MTETALTTTQSKAVMKFSPEEESVFLAGLNPEERVTALRVVQHTGLDPIVGQLNFIVYNKNDPKRRTMKWYTTRDGFNAIARRSGKFGGIKSESLLVTNKEGQDELIPLSRYNPKRHIEVISATVEIIHKDQEAPIPGTADMKSYKKSGTGSEVWDSHPIEMLFSKAYRNAYRKGWGEETAGLYDIADIAEMQPEAIDVEYEPVDLSTEPEEPAPPKDPKPTKKRKPRSDKGKPRGPQKEPDSPEPQPEPKPTTYQQVMKEALDPLYKRFTDAGIAQAIEWARDDLHVQELKNLPSERYQELLDFFKSDDLIENLCMNDYEKIARKE